MTVTAPFILYSRPGCHLCELAGGMLERLGVNWRVVDVESEPQLEERYGLRIPVVFFEPAKKELPFPFGEEQLVRFVEEMNSAR